MTKPPQGEVPVAGPRHRIAVTVIGGYLGSGKTTLVNHLLRTADERLAVLVNDFGSVNIDADLIESADGDTLRLANGCICCSLADGFAAALDTIAELDPRPDRLVIEASGVADPAQVAAYGHGPGLALDAVVVLVDTETIRTQAADGYLAQTIAGQLASADILVANKLDLVDEAAGRAVVAWLADRHPDAVIETATEARLDPALLFGREIAGTGSGGAGSDGPGPGEADTDPVAGATEPGHAEALFRSWTIEADEPMSRAEAEAVIDDLLDGDGPEVVRAKGFFRLAEHPDRPGVFQLVGRRWSLRPGDPWSTRPTTTVVVIARR